LNTEEEELQNEESLKKKNSGLEGEDEEEEEDFDQRRRHSREGEAFGRTDGKTNNTSSRRNETSFYGPALIGTSIKTHSHVHTCPLNLWPPGRNIKEHI
jgi:hypothetical protein